MKLNFVTLLIALLIALLGGYTFYVVNNAETDIPLANAIGGGLAMFITLTGAVSFSIKDSKGPTLYIRILSAIFFVAMLIQQVIFCLVTFNIQPYIIITGFLLLLYTLIAYGISRLK